MSLIVIGPERLPAVARTVGTWVGKAQRFVRGVKSDFASELQSGDLKKIIGDQNDQISELRNIVTNARNELKAGVDEATAVTKSSVDDFRKTVEENDDTSSPSDSSGSGENASVPSAQESTATSAQESTPSSETKPASTDADKKSD